MSVADKTSTQDSRLERMFGASLGELYAQAAGSDASPALRRALELRSFLVVAEEQVARIRDRVHAATAPDRDMNELSADQLRFDAQWMEAALAGRNGYVAALDQLLRTMPSSCPVHRRPVRLIQPVITTSLPPAPANARAGAEQRPRL
ncbi:hypothetical protein [Streptomyces neyagawaensis]|uniref:hypothetical protein n=1 Tax=Streptomyces neyagawaensis TaxID=42238 RepID=UPI000AF631E4|nr:hypothetical protein [Streptomyces neyagawaensis]MCL6739430.1 hypothetical protein [Streptomyces neyagawaensis]MDE1688340.1 hypothetical protein [Streptomyces neyagawaensis]MDG5808504.1 hypothetical protein [Streptomyces ossamyceticus]